MRFCKHAFGVGRRLLLRKQHLSMCIISTHLWNSPETVFTLFGCVLSSCVSTWWPHFPPLLLKLSSNSWKAKMKIKKTWSEQFKKGYSLNISQRCCRSITNNLKRKPLHTAPDHSLKLIVNLAKLQDTKLLSANMQSTPTRSPLTILFPQHLALTAGAVK